MIRDEEVPTDIVKSALRVIGQMITSSNDCVTSHLIKAGFYDVVPKLLTNSSKAFRKEAVWMLSNIAGGSVDDIESLLSKEDIMKQVVKMSTHDSLTIRKEATWVVCNCLQGGTLQHIEKLIFQYNVLQPIGSFLQQFLTTAQAIDSRQLTTPNTQNNMSLHSSLVDAKTLEIVVSTLDMVLRRFISNKSQLELVIDRCAEVDISNKLEEILYLECVDIKYQGEIGFLLETFWPNRESLHD
ncbi:importin alpha [Reticulomyxa filosa]|uniref:Importin alpha n=1 Tax=Reticulomyxa filosa TaxID=46433 RepID=X6MV55_RETFI|nr:importin alpha [Reticulomyxa filosa]|eukprot:ETO16975.1 importin alpha [Reticulomyxa filosa]